MYRGNFDQVRTPSSSSLLQRAQPGSVGDRGWAQDDSAIYSQSDSRSQRHKPLKRPESFSVRPNRRKSTNSIPGGRPMSWQAAPQGSIESHHGYPQLHKSQSTHWSHQRVASEIRDEQTQGQGYPGLGQRASVSTSDLGASYRGYGKDQIKAGMTSNKVWQGGPVNPPRMSLPQKPSMYAVASRDSGLNVSPEAIEYDPNNKENEPVQMHSMQDLRNMGSQQWSAPGAHPNSCDQLNSLSVNTEISSFPPDNPPHAQSSPNLLEDSTRQAWPPPAPDHAARVTGMPPRPPVRDESSLRYGRAFHAKSASLPVSMELPVFKQRSPTRTEKGFSQGTMATGSVHFDNATQRSVSLSQTDLRGLQTKDASYHVTQTSQPQRSSPRDPPPNLVDILPPPPSPTPPTSPQSKSRSANSQTVRDGQVPSQYSYIVKNTTPCYNTSTQTDADELMSHGVQPYQQSVGASSPGVRSPANEKSIQVHSPPWSVSTNESDFSEGPRSPVTNEPGNPQRDYRAGAIVNQLEQQHRIPETIQEDSAVVDTKKNSEAADVIARIHEHSPSQTYMLRKLSQELYGAQGWGQGQLRKERTGYLDPQKHVPGTNLSKHVRSSESRDSGFSSLDMQSIKGDRTDDESTIGYHSNVPSISVSEADEASAAHSPKHSNASSNLKVNKSTENITCDNRKPPKKFDRSKKMSLKKAYGIFDEVETMDRKGGLIPMPGDHAKSHSYSSSRDLVTANKSKENQSSGKSKDADRRRSEGRLPQSSGGLGKFLGKMKRSTSEQFRPQKEKLKSEVNKEVPSNNSGVQHRGAGARDEVPTDRPARNSDPLASQKVSHLSLSNLHDRSMSSSDSDGVFKTTLGVAQSVSSIDDQDLKVQQQQALAHFFERKTGKRLSTSSMGSFSSEQLHPGHRYSTDGEQLLQVADYPPVFSPAEPQPSPTLAPTGSVDAAEVSKAPPSISHRASMSDPVVSSDMLGKRHVEALTSGNITSDNHKKGSVTGGDVQRITSGSSVVKESSVDDPSHKTTTSKGSHSSTSAERQGAAQEEPDKDGTYEELPCAHSGLSSTEGHVMSHAQPAPVSTSHSYHITRNEGYTSQDDSPPLPPRNYRPSSASKAEQYQRKPQQRGMGFDARWSSGSYEATPKEEAYADQLREQAKKFSKSNPNMFQLNAARYQSKPVFEAPASVSTSKPVDRGNIERQEAHTPPPPQNTSHDQLHDSGGGNHKTRTDSNGLLNGNIDAVRRLHQGRYSLDSTPTSHFVPQTNLSRHKRRSAEDLPKNPTSFQPEPHSVSDQYKQYSSSGEGPAPVNTNLYPSGPVDQSVPSSNTGSVVNTNIKDSQSGTNVSRAAMVTSEDYLEQPRKQIIMPVKTNRRQVPVPQVRERNPVKSVTDPSPPQPSQYTSRPPIPVPVITTMSTGGTSRPPIPAPVITTSMSTGGSTSLVPQPNPSDNIQDRTYLHDQRTKKPVPKPRTDKPPASSPRFQGPKPWISKYKNPTVISNVPSYNVQTNGVSPTSSTLDVTNSAAGDSQNPLSPPVDKSSSPSVRSVISRIETSDSRSPRAHDWQVSSRNKISEQREDTQWITSTSNTHQETPRRPSFSNSNIDSDPHSISQSPRMSTSNSEARGPSVLPQTFTEPPPAQPFTDSNKYGAKTHEETTAKDMSHEQINERAPAAEPEERLPSPPPELLQQEPVSQVPSKERKITVPEPTLECDQGTANLPSQVKSDDSRLSDVIVTPREFKTTADYMNGIFDTQVDRNHRPSLLNKSATKSPVPPASPPLASSSPQERRDSLPSKKDESPLPLSSSYWSPPGVASMQNKMRKEGVTVESLLEDHNESLEEQKEELIDRIKQKLSLLEEEQDMLTEEVEQNNQLGKEVALAVEAKCQKQSEKDKYQLFVTELEKVLLLLLKVSGRLARAQNAVMSLPEDADADVRAALVSKQNDISEKHNDAVQLKEGIDRRQQQVEKYLKTYFTEEEFADYQHFIKMKSKLIMDQNEITEKIKLGEEQMKALKTSLDSSPHRA